MKKKILTGNLIAIVFAAIGVISCNKKDDLLISPPTVQPPGTTMIKTSGSGSSLSVYEYDSFGRATKVTVNGTNQYTFIYTGDSVIQTRYLANGSVMETYHMKLNSDSLVENYLNDKFPSIFIMYEYNADKTVRRKTNYQNGLLSNTTEYYYKDGNLLMDSTFIPNIAGWSGRRYKYFMDKSSSIENRNRGIKFWGTGNKNALKQTAYLNDGVLQNTQDYLTPETDAQGRITKTFYQPNGSGSAFTTLYTYY